MNPVAANQGDILQNVVLHAWEALEKVDDSAARDDTECAGRDATVATLAEVGEGEKWRAGGLEG